MDQLRGGLQSVLNIRPGEGRLVGLVFAYGILLYVSNVFARTASYGIFLAEFDAEVLAMTYVGIAIAAPLITTLYLRLNQRLPLSTVLIIVHVFLVVTLAAYGLALAADQPGWLVFSLPIYFGVINSLTIASFWNLLGRVYNLQQGKRLFGLLSSAEHWATVAAGFAAPLLVSRIGAANLFWVSTVFMAAAAALLVLITRDNRQRLAAVEGSEHEERQQSGSLLGSGYVRLIIGLFALFIIGVYFVDNIFYSQAELRYPNEDELAAFIGVFFGVMGVLSLIIQTFVAGRALSRFGVRAMILATPLGLLAIMIPFALVGTFTEWAAVLFWLIAAGNMYRLVLDAIDSAAVNVMYQPLPAQQRTQAQTTVLGIVYPLAIGTAGLLLLFFTELLGFTPVMLAYVLLIILVIWLWTGIRLGRAYPLQVRQALTQRVLGDGKKLPLDDASLSVVRQGLASPHLSVVLYALDTLSTATPDSMVDLLPDLLGHPLPEVRQMAIEQIERLSLVEAVPVVRRHLARESSPPVRAASLRVIAALDATGALDEVLPYLADADPRVRQGALVGLLLNDDADLRLEAGHRLTELAGSDTPDNRLLAALVIGEVARPSFHPLLQTLLADDNVEVRRAALAATGKVGDALLWPLVADALGDRATRRAAAAALSTGEAAAVPVIRTSFIQPGQSRAVLMQLARICGRIGGQEAIDLLFEHFRHPDSTVRGQILAALRQCNFRAEGSQRELVAQQIQAEAAEAAATLAIRADLTAKPGEEAPSLLLNALEVGVAQNVENIFYLLSFVTDPEAMMRAWETLRPSSQAGEDQRAYAQETIEVLVATKSKAVLLPLVSGTSPVSQLSQLATEFPQDNRTRERRLLDMLDGPSLWLQVCALHAVGQLAPAEAKLMEQVAALALDPSSSPLLKETAIWTLAHLPPVDVDRLLAESGATEVTQQVMARRDGLDKTSPTIVRVALLRRVSFFAEAPAETLLDICGRLTEVAVAADEMLFARGDEGDSMYVVANGRIRIHDGPRMLNYQATGDAFGEMALLDAAPRAASATAEETTELLRLDHDAFFELLESSPAVSRGIIRVLSRYLRGTVRSMVELDAENPITPALEPLPDVFTGLEEPTLSPIERMLLLKQVDMFNRLPDELLTELVFLLEEADVAAGETVFAEGESGDAMYIVATGKVRVHAAGHTLNYLSAGQVFGEMALLDSVPRLASVTGVEQTRLLRLSQAPFLELLEDRFELAEGIIRTLSGHLRSRTLDLADLKVAAPPVAGP